MNSSLTNLKRHKKYKGMIRFYQKRRNLQRHPQIQQKKKRIKEGFRFI